MSSERHIKVGARVELTGKELLGTIAYVGMTSFAVGKWVGVILDEPKGKNNGTIKGQQYFDCPDGYGMFVRPTQLKVISLAPDSQSRRSIEDVHSMGDQIRFTTAQPTKARLSGSRHSLSSSRQSLLGSRSQLTASLTDRQQTTSSSIDGSARSSMPAPTAAVSGQKRDTKSDSSGSLQVTGSADAVTITSNNNLSKRASFVEPGFLEIFHTQFTTQPVQSASSITQPTALSTEDKLTIAEQKKQIDKLNSQVIDLNQKLDTLKQRRNEDKERLREFDKMKIQFEQMQEFRTKIMSAQASLQKELQRAKQEAKDAIESKELHAQEMAELAENVELITLDKEMAEEKADSIQLELDSAKERIEELQVDLELLRSETQVKFGEETSSFEFKQLQQQNLRLKETLVRLRDLTAHDKHDIQKLTKELEMKRSEVTELERTKEKLSSKIDELEMIIGDLQEQVDAALGAEEMVEQLAEKKMELEDKVKALEEEILQLEALEEVHEQLVESNHDLEMDLREELDMAHSARKDALRERDAATETIYDRDQTINKFRELVQKLNEQLLHLRDKANDAKPLDDEAQMKMVNETIDYKQMFAESKAYTRAIDVQLRQIELSQANEHVQMLTSFMPESFMCRGGDHDAILVILLISRLIYKCGIIISQTRERFPAVENVVRDSILQDYKIQQYAFKCRLMHYVHNLQCTLHQILYGLNNCQAETLLRAGNSLPEMIAQEKVVDGVIELLKSNQLDENSSTENIEKCVSFFNAMNSVLLAGEDLLNETQMIRDCVAGISSACDSIQNDTAIARAILRIEGKTSDAVLLIQFLADNIESINQQVKLIRRRLPQDTNIIKCGLSPIKLDAMRQLIQALGRIMSATHLAIKQSITTIVANIEGDTAAEHTIEPNKFWNLLGQACEKIYEQDDRGPTQNFKGVLSQANTDLEQIAQVLLDKEYEIMSAANQRQIKAPTPIILRAQMIKKQLEQKNVLAATLENREADIKQLKLAAKMKQNELSEMQIRKDLAEKKLSVIQAEFEHTVEKWKNKFEEALQQLQQKEREFEKTMDHLQGDIDTLESEKLSLREKLKLTSGKRGDTSFMSVSPASSTAAHNVFSSLTSGTTSIIYEEFQLLKHAFNLERNQRLQMQAEQLKHKLKSFEPIFVPKPKDKRLIELASALKKMKHAWILSLLQTVPKSPQPSPRPTPVKAVAAVAVRRKYVPQLSKSSITNQVNKLATEILHEYLQRNPHRAAPSDFGAFPNLEVKQLLQV